MRFTNTCIILRTRDIIMKIVCVFVVVVCIVSIGTNEAFATFNWPCSTTTTTTVNTINTIQRPTTFFADDDVLLFVVDGTKKRWWKSSKTNSRYIYDSRCYQQRQHHPRISFVKLFAAASSSSSSSPTPTPTPTPDDENSPVKDDDYQLQNNRYDFNRKKNRQWLMERFKFTKEQIKQRSHNWGFLTKDNSILEGRADWLQERLGFNSQEMNRIIQMQPSILQQKIDTYLGPTLKCLETSLKLDRKSLEKLVLKNPVVLTSKKEDIEPKLNYLKGRLSLDDVKIRNAIQRYPNVLTGGNIEPKFEWLQQQLDLDNSQLGKLFLKYPRIILISIDSMDRKSKWLQHRLSLSNSQLRKIVCSSPDVLQFSTETLDNKMKWLQHRMSLSNDQIRKLICGQPQLLHLKTDRMEHNLNWYQNRLSLTATGLVSYILKMPSLLGCNITKNIEPTLNFYVESIETNEDIIAFVVANPACLAYSLKKRLIPRLAEAREAGMRIDTATLRKIAFSPKEKWANMLANL